MLRLLLSQVWRLFFKKDLLTYFDLVISVFSFASCYLLDLLSHARSFHINNKKKTIIYLTSIFMWNKTIFFAIMFVAYLNRITRM